MENLGGLKKISLRFKDYRLEKSYRHHKRQLVQSIYLKPILVMSVLLVFSTTVYLLKTEYSSTSGTLLLVIDVCRLLVEVVFAVSFSALFFAKSNFAELQLK